MSNIDRKLATVRKITAITPIKGADSIELAHVDGWRVVVKKGEYQVNDLAVYCEIDSWIPHDIAPFLSKGQEPKEYNGVKGARLRSIKLRGQISQGLLLPLEHHMWEEVLPQTSMVVALGEDVTEQLGIQKWEAPIPAQLAGQIEGNFPTHLVPKTDQERIQNCAHSVNERLNDLSKQQRTDNFGFLIEEKLDGSSCTIIVHDGKFRVCSRNLELRRDENNSFWKVASRYEEAIMAFYEKHGKAVAFQGELIGEGIQGNPYKIHGQELYVFDVYSIDDQCYLSRYIREMATAECGMKNVPIIGFCDIMLNDVDVNSIITIADGASVLNPNVLREGVVYKCAQDTSLTFKSVSNKWLLEKGE